ncbi:MAG: hypothetical protein EBU90_01860 [Proteobacteria bacterium]|nr:hypothetical protein [Pseudomonadota bacterium]
MACVNRRLAQLVKTAKWRVIDTHRTSQKIPNITYNCVPLNKETHQNYFWAIDWQRIIYHNGSDIPDVVIDTVMDNMEKQLVLGSCKVSSVILYKYFNLVDYTILLEKQELPIDLLQYVVSNHNLTPSDWASIWTYQRLDVDFIEKHKQYVKWYSLSCNKYLSKEVILKYENSLFWPELTKRSIRLDVLESFVHRLDPVSWTNVSWYSTLSPQFIRQYIDHLDKRVILHTQNVPIDVIEVLLDSIDSEEYFNIVSKYQALSTDFIARYKSKLNVKCLVSNHRISRKVLSELYNPKT